MQVQIDLKDRVGELLEILEYVELKIVDALDFDKNIEELSTKELIKRYKKLNNSSSKAVDTLYKAIEILEIYEF